MNAYDVVVVGLGGMGSAAAAQLAKRRKRVLGLEQFALGHDLGASCGLTRIIRKAYFEGPQYIPLLLRAYDLWRELEGDTGMALLDLTGLLMAGDPEGVLIRGVLASAARYDLPIAELAPAVVARRFPQVSLRTGETVLFEADAGVVFPELAIAAHQTVAREHGADLRGNVCVSGWRRSAFGALVVEVDGRAAFEAEQIVLCAGPWLAPLARELQLPIVVERDVQVWFAPLTAAFARAIFPAFLLDRTGLRKPLYGFPDFGDGVKAALHGSGARTSADQLDREIHAQDIALVRAALNEFLPGAGGHYRFGKACMYAMTPDEHFLIDRHPQDRGVVFAGGFSGHGYKFCPVIGEVIADLVCDTPRHDIDFLSLRRFAGDEPILTHRC